MAIYFTMTAVRRPEILKRTLDSFQDHMGLRDHSLVINIDPWGPGTIPECSALVWEHFHNGAVTFKTPNVAHFGQAFCSVWDIAVHHGAQYIFNLEDDWELLRPVDLGAMIKAMERHPDLAALRLPAFPAGDWLMQTWNRWVPYNHVDGFFEMLPEQRLDIGFCGHPTLLRGDFVRAVLPYLDANHNPEKQFHGPNKQIIQQVQNWRWVIWAKPGDPPAVRDIGREWMGANGYQKAGNKAFFVNWERVHHE